jgi:hypothetical protein
MSRPKVQSVQTIVRLIYEDGVVAAVASVPQEVDYDPFEEHIGSTTEGVLNRVATHGEALMQTIKDSGPEVLYEQARANPGNIVKEIERVNQLKEQMKDGDNDTRGTDTKAS